MNKLILLFILTLAGETTVDRTTLLTGSSKKTWYLYAMVPESSNGTCHAGGPVLSDNIYTFSANGSYEFDHGAITEVRSCDSEDCCSDMVNSIGTWKFTNEEKGLRVIATGEKNNPANTERILIFDATIDQLDEQVLKISQTDPESMIRYSFEFRKK